MLRNDDQIVEREFNEYITSSASQKSATDIDIERRDFYDKLSQAELTIDQLEEMIKGTISYVSQLSVECQKLENEHMKMLEEKRIQDELASKETEDLKRELKHLTESLKTTNAAMEKLQTQNAKLKNEIIANRFKLFHMHFNAIDFERSEKSPSSTSTSTSSDTITESTEISILSTTAEFKSNVSGEVSTQSR